MTGTLSAGLSSIFPALMIAPVLLSDYNGGKMDLKSTHFRILTIIACLFGLIIPVLGSNPISAQIATQIVQVFILPVVIGGIIILLNRKNLMGKYKAGILMNAGLISAFVFSCLISYTGILAIIEMLKSITTF
jgi:Mn2+/Fe2+ NRAMP family transporter